MTMNIFSFFVNRSDMMMLVSIFFLLVYAVFFGVFCFTGKRVRRLWPMPVLACLWLFWGLLESYCENVGANIRVDLLLLVPFVLGCTIGLTICQVILLMPKKQAESK